MVETTMWISDTSGVILRSPQATKDPVNKRRGFFTPFRMTDQRGFTLIELLVVIAIIGILSTVATVSLVQARRRARDTKRISDIQQLRSALLIYSNQRATYPGAENDAVKALGGSDARCLDGTDEGFRETCDADVIMQRVPSDPAGYQYSKIGTNSYSIGFTLEGQIGALTGGACAATQEGVTCTP